MLKTGFQGRKLAESIEVWRQMLQEEDLTIFLGLSGAMVPGGMRRIISYLVRNRFVDCLVSTGANIFHDCHEALGGHHYLGSHQADDHALLQEGVDRIYDIFASEDEFRSLDRLVAEFIAGLEPGKRYSTRELTHLLGGMLKTLKPGLSGTEMDSITVAAYDAGVPIFIPAFCDSSLGIGAFLAYRQKKNGVVIDQIKDVDEITQIVEQSAKTGVIYIGGGVPKNFIQQTEVILSLLGQKTQGHSYAIQYTTDAPHWGGLSGCTFQEAISWGKISPVSRNVQVFTDATIALPLVAHALHEDPGRRQRHPVFNWKESGLNLGIKRE